VECRFDDFRHGAALTGNLTGDGGVIDNRCLAVWLARRMGIAVHDVHKCTAAMEGRQGDELFLLAVWDEPIYLE
jgi:hypothetical protein